MTEFCTQAMAAGFSQAQAEFMERFLAQVGHRHEIEDIDDLPEELEAIAGDEEESDEEDEEA